MYLFSNNKHIIRRILIIGIVLLFAYLPFHPFFTAWVGSVTGVYAPVKIWKDVVVAGAVIIAIAYSISRKTVRQRVWRDPLNLLIFIYALWHFILFTLFSDVSEESGVAGLIFNLRFLALFVFIRIMFAIYSSKIGSLRESIQKTILITAALVAAIAVMQLVVPLEGFYRFFGYDGVNTISPVAYVDDNVNTVRAFSTLRGPNELGSFLILPITITVGLLVSGVRNRYMIFLLVALMVALISSYSRSALIGAFVSILSLTVLYFGRRITSRQRIAAATCVLLVGLIGLWGSISIPQLRLFIFHSSPGDVSLFEGSTQDHFKATADGIGDAAQYPFGRGPGEAGPASFYQTDAAARIAENYYVQIAQEVGVIGLGIFVLINALVAYRLLRLRKNIQSLVLLAALIGLSVSNLFLHSWADDPTSYLWWGYAAIVIGFGESNRIKNKRIDSASDPH